MTVITTITTTTIVRDKNIDARPTGVYSKLNDTCMHILTVTHPDMQIWDLVYTQTVELLCFNKMTQNIVTYVWHRLVRQRHTWLHCDWTGSGQSRIWTCHRMQGQSWLLWLAVLAFLCTGRDDTVYKLELWQLDRHWSHQPRNLSNAFQLQPHSQSVEANSHRLFSRDVVLTSFLGLGPKGIWASHHLVSSRCFVHNFDSRLQLQSCVPRSVIRGLNLFRPKMEKQPTCLRGWTYRHHFCTCRYL